MSLKKTKVSVMMTNPSFGNGRKAICLRVTDELSRILIVEVELPYEEFVTASFCGMGYGVAEVNISDNIGKEKETSTFKFPFDSSEFQHKDREKAAYEMAKELAPEGWEVSKYFGSKGQIPYGKGEATAHIYRFIEKTKGEEE